MTPGTAAQEIIYNCIEEDGTLDFNRMLQVLSELYEAGKEARI